MPTERKPQPKLKKTSAERTRAYRARKRAQGLVPVTIWTFDINDPVFRKRLEDDCRRLRDDPHEQAIMDELEAFQADFEPWD